MNLKHSHMSERKLHVRATYSSQEMLAQLQCNYHDWLSQGHTEDEVFGTLRNRVNPLVNGFYWRDVSARQRLGIAWRYFEEWRSGQRYLRQRAAGVGGPASAERSTPADGATGTRELAGEVDADGR